MKELYKIIGADHQFLDSLILYKGVFVNESPLRIGAGRGAKLGQVDLPVLKDAKERPYIPGSSLKGVMRSTVEIMLRSENKVVCDVMMDKTCAFKVSFGVGLIEQYSTEENLQKEKIESLGKRLAYRFGSNKDITTLINKINEAKKELDRLKEVFKEELSPCLACKLFGNQALSSHVVVYNAYSEETVNTSTITRVAIDRFTNASLGKALFIAEFIPPYYSWNFSLRTYNLEGESLQLFNRLLELMRNQGIHVGSMQSAGFGLIKIKSLEQKEVVYKGGMLGE
ncbi:hypothetical protein B9Q02_11995 [Candidatus Marsarchaeota G1 archaeon BE_D]|jgi:CRISPR/Cas system CSM-associated protein Csm3 (group 7 of RAMP superfamily)|nr:MAG: hypothetical protein B9Q02_11995 [Candidatus Marsarchaeota G1 archaeon BE_D]